MRYIPLDDARKDDERKAYRPPEMAGPQSPPTRPRSNRDDDDVTRQPLTMAALLLAAGLIFGAGLLVIGSSYGPSPIEQSEAPPAGVPNQIN
jgi:anti-sigma factor RsiW